MCNRPVRLVKRTAAQLTLSHGHRNPVLWHHLASVRFAEGEFVQAENLAAKSNSLAPGNRALQIRNWLLIADARRSRGDSAGASAAEQRVRTLEAD